jgi:L-lactate permease
MPVFVVKNETDGNYAYCTMNEGIGKVLRFGAYSEEVIDRLRWMRDILGPTLGKALRTLDNGLAVNSLIAKAIAMGDEFHQRNIAASLVFMCWFYGRGKAVVKGLPAVIVMTVIQGGGQLFLSQINTTLCCFIPSVVSLVVLMLMGRMKMYRDEWSVEDSPIMNRKAINSSEGETISDMNLIQAFIPYIVLSALTIVVLTVAPINKLLSSISVGFAFPETSTGYGFVNAATDSYSPIAPFTHASMKEHLADSFKRYKFDTVETALNNVDKG